MAIAFVQAVSANAQSVSITPTAGNALVGFSMAHGSTNWPDTILMSGGSNTYVNSNIQNHNISVGSTTEAFYALAVAGGATSVSATWSGNSSGSITYDYILVCEFSGVGLIDTNAASNVLDVSAVAVGDLIWIFKTVNGSGSGPGAEGNFPTGPTFNNRGNHTVTANSAFQTGFGASGISGTGSQSGAGSWGYISLKPQAGGLIDPGGMMGVIC